MPIFLANRANIQAKRLHRRLKHRLQTVPLYSSVRLKRADARDPGRYRVTAETTPETFIDVASYPTPSARIEVGFDVFTPESYDYYWLSWVEPDRNLLVGWHQDETHSEFGPVHLQVNDGEKPVARESATFVDSHPLDVFSRRLADLPNVVKSVEWRGGRPVGFDT
jgi:hypothetical protein